MLVLLNGQLVRSGPLAEKQETYVCVQVGVGGGVLEWVDGLLSLVEVLWWNSWIFFML